MKLTKMEIFKCAQCLYCEEIDENIGTCSNTLRFVELDTIDEECPLDTINKKTKKGKWYYMIDPFK